jgi:type II secretory ATPase GspE/PulE/Tfp pilus assembly ATPase PilB-like protein
MLISIVSTDPCRDDLSTNIGQPVITSLKSMSQLQVVESELVQHGGM